MNTEPLFSAHWHRVRDVRARLADDVAVVRHTYRKRVSWVLHRPATGSLHRLDAASFELIDRLDGTISVGKLWEQALEQRDHEAPTQDAWMHLLADLHAADLLVVDTRIPVESLFERRKAKRVSNQRQRYLNPLYLRFGMFDPDDWLNRLTPLAHALFSRTAFVLWIALITLGAFVMFTNGSRLWDEAQNVARLSPYMAALFFVVYPPLKLLHELGHALAIKRCGGSVHEMGVALLIMFPMPYVDASASAVFKSKLDRMLVSAAGIMVELCMAVLGLLLWASSSGFASELGLVLFLTGGLSTLLINGNPLLKFDGYYLLADWLEIPNLQARSRRAIARVLRRCLTGKDDDKPRSEDVAEWRWLVGYGAASALYRTALMLSIAWIVSQRWVLFGFFLALFALWQAILLPLWRGVKALFKEEQLQNVRTRGIALGIPMLVLSILTFVPLPHASVTSGVVWLPDEAVIRAAGVCEVDEVLTEPGSAVLAGDVLFTCTDHELDAHHQYQLARLAELEATLSGVARTDQVEYSKLLPERDAAQARLADVEHRISMQQYRATVDGHFDITGTTTLLGRALSRGEVAAYTIPVGGRTIRLAFPERQFADVDQPVERVEVRVQSPGSDDAVQVTSILRRSPRASMEVPSAALSAMGGGPHAADPDGDGRLLLQPVMDFELDWPSGIDPAPIGQHVGVRFVHSAKPLAGRFVDTMKRAFMDRNPA